MMGYVARTVTAEGALKAIVEGTYLVLHDNLTTQTTAKALYYRTVDVTDLDYVHSYCRNTGANTETLEVKLSGTTKGTHTIATGVQAFDTWDLTGDSGDKILEIYVKSSGANGVCGELRFWTMEI